MIKHCFLLGKNTTQPKEWLNKCYGTSSPSHTTVKRRYAEFERGRTSTDDAERSGRPSHAVTEVNIKKVHRTVLDDRKIEVSEIADIVKI